MCDLFAPLVGTHVLPGPSSLPRSPVQASDDIDLPDHLFSAVPEALAEIRAGRPVIVVDDQHSQEGDVVIAGDLVTREDVTFLLNNARGVVCVALPEQRCDELGLAAQEGAARHAPAAPTLSRPTFAVSIEAREGVSTGISAADRARTLRVASDPESSDADLVRPGHILPLRAKSGGLLARPGRAEAAVDLARHAGRAPAAVICTILNERGMTAQHQDLITFGERHGLRLVRIGDIVAYRRGGEDSGGLDRRPSEADTANLQ